MGVTSSCARPAPRQVTLAKPLGVKFARGNDGGAYVVRSDPKLGNTDSRVRPARAVALDDRPAGQACWGRSGHVGTGVPGAVHAQPPCTAALS